MLREQVAVPQSARAGDLMKVHGPDGGQFAFAVPANVPANGIIKVDLPFLAEDENSTETRYTLARTHTHLMYHDGHVLVRVYCVHIHSSAGNATASEAPGSANATEPVQSGMSTTRYVGCPILLTRFCDTCSVSLANLLNLNWFRNE